MTVLCRINSTHRKKIRKERRESEPRSLPPRRQSLSVPAPPSRSWLSFFRTTPPPPPTSASPSPLLCLPAEIRKMIFFEALGGCIIHLVQLRKRLGHIHCRPLHPHTAADQSFYRQWECIMPEKRQLCHRHEYPVHEGDARSDDSGLALLQTCRQIYREALSCLYEDNIFDINHPQTLQLLARTIPAPHLARIRSLQVNWADEDFPHGYTSPVLLDQGWLQSQEVDYIVVWLNMCRIIATRMLGLKHLVMTFVRSYPILELSEILSVCHREDIEILLRPLRVLRGLKTFELRVSKAIWDVKALEAELSQMYCREKDVDGLEAYEDSNRSSDGAATKGSNKGPLAHFRNLKGKASSTAVSGRNQDRREGPAGRA